MIWFMMVDAQHVNTMSIVDVPFKCECWRLQMCLLLMKLGNVSETSEYVGQRVDNRRILTAARC